MYVQLLINGANKILQFKLIPRSIAISHQQWRNKGDFSLGSDLDKFVQWEIAQHLQRPVTWRNN